MSNMPNLQEKLKKAKENQLIKRKGNGLRKGKKNLTEGQYSILYAKIIDMLNEGHALGIINQYVRDYYLKTAGYHLTNPYEVVSKAKALWLKNTQLPSLDNYKKEMYLKSERLESEIKERSRRDITNQADTIINLWKHRDELQGLHKDNQINVAVGINMPTNTIINSLEVDDEQDGKIPPEVK